MISGLSGQLGALGRTRRRISVGPSWDADALAYLANVEAEDGEALELPVAMAMNALFLGLKDPAHPTPTQPTHWAAMPAASSALLMSGMRTLAGALVPLRSTMPTPTNNNFVSGDFNRKTGLVGNGTTKFLATNVNNNNLPQNNRSLCVFVSTDGVGNQVIVGQGVVSGGSQIINSTESTRSMRLASDASVFSLPRGTGFFGGSRSADNELLWRSSASAGADANNSASLSNGQIWFFSRSVSPTYFSGRLAFAGFMLAVDLAYLNTLLVAYMAAIASALP